MKSQVGQWGNSLAVRIPKYIVEALKLKANDVLEFTVENGKLVIEPVQTLPKLNLEELLAEVTEPPEPEVDWGRPMGNEIGRSCYDGSTAIARLQSAASNLYQRMSRTLAARCSEKN
jgi:antitoxin MazE